MKRPRPGSEWLLRAQVARSAIPEPPRTMPQRKTDRRSRPRRVEYLLIECVTPELDAGRYPVKRIVGDTVAVGADIIKEGHDQVAARVIYKGPDSAEWRESPLTYDYDTDRWTGFFTVDRIG